jgi:hypothetical protein
MLADKSFASAKTVAPKILNENIGIEIHHV